MNKITTVNAVKIDEYGGYSLATVKFDEYFEVYPQYFDCKCCDSDEELIWYGMYIMYRSPYVLQIGGKKHSVECQLPVNPAANLTDIECPCGFEHKSEHRGVMYMIRFITDQTGTKYKNCTEDDFTEIDKIIYEHKNSSKNHICMIS